MKLSPSFHLHPITGESWFCLFSFEVLEFVKGWWLLLRTPKETGRECRHLGELRQAHTMEFQWKKRETVLLIHLSTADLITPKSCAEPSVFSSPSLILSPNVFWALAKGLAPRSLGLHLWLSGLGRAGGAPLLRGDLAESQRGGPAWRRRWGTGCLGTDWRPWSQGCKYPWGPLEHLVRSLPEAPSCLPLTS